MKNYIHQPLIFNDFKSNNTTANNNIHNNNNNNNNYSIINRFISSPDMHKSCAMSIYEINPNNILDNSSVFQSILVPSTHTEWIISYNYLNDDAAFYCIGPVTKKRIYELNKFDAYFEVCFNDEGSYFAKGFASNIFPSCMTDEIFEYIPAKESYEFKLIQNFKTCRDFNLHINMFMDFLKECKQYYTIPDNMIKLTAMIKKSCGNIHVSELATRLGYSERHISRMFKETLGMSPKDYCKIIRFQNILYEMYSSNEKNNSAYMTGLGYSDQAHFQREFKAFTGITPKQFLHFINNQ